MPTFILNIITSHGLAPSFKALTMIKKNKKNVERIKKRLKKKEKSNNPCVSNIWAHQPHEIFICTHSTIVIKQLHHKL